MNAQDYAGFFEQLTPETSFEEYCTVFDENVFFKDPFHEVTGVDKVYSVFQRMYHQLHEPKFKVYEIVTDTKTAYMRWHFTFAMSEKADRETFEGISRVTFSNEGKALSHIDYWDASEHVYGKIPLLGALIRWVKRRIRGD